MPVYNGLDENGQPTEYHRDETGKYTIKNKKYEKLIGSRDQVYLESAYKTKYGVYKKGLTKNKWGKIVSRKKQQSAKKDMRLLKCGHGFRKGVFIENGVRIPSKIQQAINLAYQSGYKCVKAPENFKYNYPRQKLEDLNFAVRQKYKNNLINVNSSPRTNNTNDFFNDSDNQELPNPFDMDNYYLKNNIKPPKTRKRNKKRKENKAKREQENALIEMEEMAKEDDKPLEQPQLDQPQYEQQQYEPEQQQYEVPPDSFNTPVSPGTPLSPVAPLIPSEDTGRKLDNELPEYDLINPKELEGDSILESPISSEEKDEIDSANQVYIPTRGKKNIPTQGLRENRNELKKILRKPRGEPDFEDYGYLADTLANEANNENTQQNDNVVNPRQSRKKKKNQSVSSSTRSKTSGMPTRSKTKQISESRKKLTKRRFLENNK